MSGSFYYSTNHPAYMQALLFFRLPSQQFQHHGNGTIGCGGHRQQPIQHPSGKKIGAKKHKSSRQQKPNRTDLLYPLFPPVSSFLRNPRRQVCLCRFGCKRNGVHDLRAEMQPAAQFRCRNRQGRVFLLIQPQHDPCPRRQASGRQLFSRQRLQRQYRYFSGRRLSFPSLAQKCQSPKPRFCLHNKFLPVTFKPSGIQYRQQRQQCSSAQNSQYPFEVTASRQYCQSRRTQGAQKQSVCPSCQHPLAPKALPFVDQFFPYTHKYSIARQPETIL